MAPSLAMMNGVPILLLSVAVPLRILQLALCSFNSQRGSHRTPTRSLFVLAFASALVVSVYAFSDPAAGQGAEAAVSKVVEVRRKMATEIQSLKDRIFELESALEESATKLEAKSGALEENTKLIEAMERDIQHLIDEQETIKV